MTPAKDLITKLYKDQSARILAVLVGVFGPHRFALAEDVLQEAFGKALVHWERDIPKNPAAWIVKTAKNQAIDRLRAQTKEVDLAALGEDPSGDALESQLTAAFTEPQIQDDQLRMIFMCCHPQIKPENRIPLILKTLCGFTIPAIARALVIPEATVKKRLFRTREKLREHNFALPEAAQIPTAMDSVHTVLYLLFSEGFHSSNPKQALQLTMCQDAMGLVRLLVDQPRLANQDTLGLLALMHFQIGRVAAKVDRQGNLIPINLQDRSRWDIDLFKTAMTLLQTVPRLPEGASGRFLIEALIAKEHCFAASFSQTNWQAIAALYARLVALTHSPIAELNQAIAWGYAGQLEAAIEKVTELSAHRLLEKSHMPLAVLAHFHAMNGQRDLAYAYADRAEARGGTPHEHRAMREQLERLL